MQELVSVRSSNVVPVCDPLFSLQLLISFVIDFLTAFINCDKITQAISSKRSIEIVLIGAMRDLEAMKVVKISQFMNIVLI